MSTQSPLAIEATGLVKSFGDDPRRRRRRPRRAHRVRLRRARPERRRQDDDDPDAGHAAAPRRRRGARARPRHRRRGRRRARPRQPHRPARLGRRGPDRPREPRPARAACSASSAPQAKARADELLEAFGLADAAGRLVKNYSGGMRRRLDIAASIVVTPQLMFLDEPTTGLDPRSRNQVWDIIRALVAEGTTILLCTQYLEEADQLADGIAVIDHGKVIAEGTPGQLKASVGSGRAARAPARPRPAARGRAGARAASSTPCTSSPIPRRCRRRAPTPTGRAEAVAELARAGHRGSPTSRSASRASTRCSWR